MNKGYVIKDKKFDTIEELNAFIHSKNFLKIGGRAKYILLEFNFKELTVRYGEKTR